MRRITAVVKVTEEYLEKSGKEPVEREVVKQLSLRFMKKANLKTIRETGDREYTEFTLIGYLISEEEVRELHNLLFERLPENQDLYKRLFEQC